MLLTQSKAAETFSISRAALCKKAKYNPAPGYFIQSGKHLMVETDHPEWIALMEKRNKKGVFSSGTPKKPAKPAGKAVKKKIDKKTARAMADNAAEVKEQNRIKMESMSLDVEMKKIEKQKKVGTIIDFDLANFLFFGYMERLNVELLNLSNKIAPMIENLVKEGDFAGVLSRFHKEHQKILKAVKKSQAKDLKDWENTK